MLASSRLGVVVNRPLLAQRWSVWGMLTPIGRRSGYDGGKRVAEPLMFDYHRQHGVDIRVARIFNTYGPRMALDDGRVVSSFIVQALAGRVIAVYVEGTQTSPVCDVADLVDGMGLVVGADGFLCA